MSSTPQFFMSQALLEAQKAYDINETPVGAVIVKNNEIISTGFNERELKQDPICHAEISAIKKACKALGTWRLNECDLYVTLEPCPMCAGAMIQSRIGKLYYGATDLKAGAAGSLFNLFSIKGFNHEVEVYGGILEEECSFILKDFFMNLRKNI